MKRLSEQLKRALNKHNMKVTFYTQTTLRSLLSKPKDHIPKEDRNIAVYQMNCKDCKAVYMGETKRTLNIKAEEHITAIKSANKTSHTAECCRKYNMTLTANIRKYWTLRKIGRQVPSRSQSTQKKTRIISMEYLETNTMRKQSKENNHQNYNILK